MTHQRFAAVALAAAMLVAAAPALAGNGSPDQVTAKTLQLEQLGPKLLPGRRIETRLLASTTRILPITFRTLEVEELGPKYLLGK